MAPLWDLRTDFSQCGRKRPGAADPAERTAAADDGTNAHGVAATAGEATAGTAKPETTIEDRNEAN